MTINRPHYFTILLIIAVGAFGALSEVKADDIFRGYIPCKQGGNCANQAGEKSDKEVGRIGGAIPEGDDREIADGTTNEEIKEENAEMCEVHQPALERVFIPMPDEDEPNNCKEVGCKNGNLIERIDDSDTPIDSVPNDCKSLSCDVGEFVVVFDDTDTPEQDDIHNCRAEVCDNGTVVSVFDNTDISEEDAVCKMCSEGNIVPDLSKNQQPTEANKCLICDNGELRELEFDTRAVIDSVSINSKNPAVERLTSPVTRLLQSINLDRFLEFNDIAGQVKRADCCSPSVGVIEDGIRETSGGVSIQLKVEPQVRIIPPQGSPVVTEFEFKKRFVEVRFRVGVYLAATPPAIVISGGKLEDICKNEDCFFAQTELVTEIKFSAIAEGYVCVNLGPIDDCAGLGFELGVKAPIGGTLAYNNPCGSELTGKISAGPLILFIKGGVGLPAEAEGGRGWELTGKFEYPN